jgi:hypothetical protein
MNIIETLKTDNLKPQLKTETVEQLLVILKKILPDFNVYLEKKSSFVKKSMIFFILAGLFIIIGIVIASATRSVFGFLIPLIASIGFGIAGYFLKLKASKILFNPPIKKIAKSRVEFGLYPFENGCVMVDEEKTMGATELNFPTIDDFNSSIKLIEKYRDIMSHLPYIMEPEGSIIQIGNDKIKASNITIFNLEIQLENILNELQDNYQKSKKVSVELGMLEAYDQIAEFLSDYKFKDIPDSYLFKGSRNIIQELEMVQGIINNKRESEKKNSGLTDKIVTTDVDEYSSEFLNELNDSSKKFYNIRITTINNILGSNFSRLFDLMHFGAYSFYCPYCNEELIKELLARDYTDMASGKSYEPVTMNPDTKVLLTDWQSGTWKCRACERETITPLPVHKMYEEVFLPAYNTLLLENEKDRLKIYANFIDKIIKFKQEFEKEFSEISRENKRDIDIETYKLKEYESRISSNSKSIEKMEQLMIELKVLYEEDVEKINNYMTEARNRIVNENNRNSEKIWGDFNELEKETSEAIQKYAKQARLEQQARDDIWIEIANANIETAHYARVSAEIDYARAREADLDSHPFIKDVVERHGGR